MLILVNKTSNSGQGAVKWEKVEHYLKQQKISYDARCPGSADECVDIIRQEIKADQKLFIAAGGDGTANLVLNTLFNPETDAPYDGITYGAIGLGSSNDFHKPFEDFPDADGVPLRVNESAAKAVDVGMVTFTDINGKEGKQYFILNASIGFVAQGNAYFNSGKKILNWINSKSNDLAIAYTILVNLFTYKNFKATIQLDDKPASDHNVTAMGIIKKVQFAGDLKYDTPVTDDDGMFDVNLWENMGKIRLIRTISSVSEGKFTGLPNTRTWRAKKVGIIPEKPIPLEYDGEISYVTKADLSVLPKILNVCR